MSIPLIPLLSSPEEGDSSLYPLSFDTDAVLGGQYLSSSEKVRPGGPE